MLVLSRKPGERIRIGESIWVEVRRVAGNRVTLAVEAPKDIRILRGELEPFAEEFANEVPPPEAIQPYRVEHVRIARSRVADSRRLEAAGV
jgi:carbon storage regulator CsrA